MRKIAKNIIWGLIGQLLGLAMSIILPRFVLISFGSEVNGITSTITQVFTYIALLEAGIGNASLNCLYRNIAQNDKAGISETVSATKKYFRNIIPIYVICVVAFAVLFPLVIITDVPAYTVRGIILLQGISGIINFYFTNAYTQLLVADGRNYVSSNLTLLVKAVSTSVQIVLIIKGFDIISVQLSLLCAYIIKAIIINVYIRKKYPWLMYDPDADIKMLAQRNAFVVHEISTVIFQSTDVFLVSMFCSIKEASVYSIYNMIFGTLSSISVILFKGIDFNLGAEYHRDTGKYIKMHDIYETVYSCFVFAIISAAYIVTLPFVRLYTAGVRDAEYIRPILPLLFSLIQVLSCSRAVASKLITISGRAKDTAPNSIAEMVINIVASVALANIYGMPGVLLGTIVALVYRTNDIIIYANKKILKRAPWRTYKTMLLNFSIFFAIIFFTKAVSIEIVSYVDFFVSGMVVLIASLCLYFGVHFLFSKDLQFASFTLCKKFKIMLSNKRN